MIRNRLLKFFIISILFSTGCDKGISPEPEGAQAAGFSGTVFFTGAWPDSIIRTHLVVFKDPLNSINDFNPFNLRFVSLEIPYGSTIFNYNSLDSSSFSSIAAGNYAYVAVAQSKTPELSLNRIDWFVAGVYYSDNDTTKPGILIIPENTLMTGINILVDFNNPPLQPPGGN